MKGSILIPVQAIDDDSGVQSISLYENDNLIETVSSDSYSFIVDTTLLGEGEHIFKVVASDNKGNEAFAVRSYVVDNTAPSVEAGTGKIANGLFVQDATVTDTNGIATYQWNQQSGPGTVTFGSKETEDTAISADIDGTYVIRLTAIDNAGNSAADDFTLIWDTISPSIGYASIAKANNSHVKGTLSVPVSASDTVSGLSKVQLYVGSTNKGEKTSGPYTFSIDTTKLANGKNTFKIVAYDKAGNRSYVTRYYYVDNTKPRTYAPSSTTVNKDTYAKLSYKVTDKFSPKAYVKIKIKNSSGKVVKTLLPGFVYTNKLLVKSFKASFAKGKYTFLIYASDKAGNTQYNIAKNTLTIK